jgi:hypothetical protein
MQTPSRGKLMIKTIFSEKFIIPEFDWRRSPASSKAKFNIEPLVGVNN